MVVLAKTLFVARMGEGMFADGMWIFYLEALLVLAIGLFIVWWTMPKQRPPAPQPQETVQPVRMASGSAAIPGEALAKKEIAQRATGNTGPKD